MRTQLTVDFSKIKHNIQTVRNVIPEGCDIIAVVKANAYGHGDVPVAKYLESIGVSRFAVACMSEAKALRAGGVGGEIIILSYVDPEDAAYAMENNIRPAVVSMDHARALSAEAQRLKGSLKVHLKINTGMNRVGFDCKTPEQMALIEEVYKLPGLEFTGIFSHFSSSDDTSEGADPYTRLQMQRFAGVLEHLKACGINPGLRHISNSGAIGKYPQARYDAVRCGGLTYGYNTAFDAKLPVIPAMEWKAAVTCVRTIGEGDCVSYSRHFEAHGPVRLATVSVGYADGYPRALSNKGYVLLRGCKAPIRGNICMDQMMVDITDIPGVAPGDEAILIGSSGSLTITADDVADMAGTCMHDILSSIGQRVERAYI